MTEWHGLAYRAARTAASWRPIRAAGEFGPERLLLNFALALIGVGGLLEAPRPDGLLAHWPTWFGYYWSAAMLVGGCSALVGIVKGWRTAEWLGYVLIGGATLIGGIATLVIFGTAGTRSGILFLAIAAAKGIRLLLSYVAREEVLRADARRHAVEDGEGLS